MSLRAVVAKAIGCPSFQGKALVLLMSQNDQAIREQIAFLQAQLSNEDERPLLPPVDTPVDIMVTIPPMEYVKGPPVITETQLQARERSIAEGERLRDSAARGFDLSAAVLNGSHEVPEL